MSLKHALRERCKGFGDRNEIFEMSSSKIINGILFLKCDYISKQHAVSVFTLGEQNTKKEPRTASKSIVRFKFLQKNPKVLLIAVSHILNVMYTTIQKIKNWSQ